MSDFPEPTEGAERSARGGDSGRSKRKQVQNDASDTASKKRRWRKVTDATIYGPGFAEVFEAYRSHLNDEHIDTSRHLMSLCLDHLIDFVNWARDSDSREQWINEVLQNNLYLRPGVRSGVVAILIYSFLSIKSAATGGDMFSVLRDTTNGMGIVNRYSIKLYSDPFQFVYFLKTCVSGLIDAGVLPDNERVDKHKKVKPQVYNHEELAAFHTMKAALVGHLDSGDNQAARKYVEVISSHWLDKQQHQFHKNCLFTAALKAAGTTHVHAAEHGADISWNHPSDISVSSRDGSINGHRHNSSAYVLSSTPPSSPAHSMSEDDFFLAWEQEEAGMLYVPQPPVVPQMVRVLRFEKVGLAEWEIRDTGYVQVDNLINSMATENVCFVDESALAEELSAMSMLCKNQAQSRGLLSRELQMRRALVTTWPRTELAQFRQFLHHMNDANRHEHLSLLDLWHQKAGGAPAAPSPVAAAEGCIVFESVQMVDIIIRSNAQLHIAEDIWCSIYRNELFVDDGQQSAADFLCSLFPQLIVALSGLTKEHVAIHYCAQPCSNANGEMGAHIPAKQGLTAYRTVGTMATPVAKVLGRLEITPTPMFHDFVLQTLTVAVPPSIA